MIQIKSFTFNPFQENTYVLYDESRECVIIDPGCLRNAEKEELSGFIEKENLRPVALLNTHCHIDHVFGNKFIADKYNLALQINEKDLPTLHATVSYAGMFGVKMETSPEPEIFLDEGDVVKFGNSMLEIVFTPGHSPGSICFFERGQKFVIGGDVLFYGSIGRTDFPGCSHAALISSIKNKLFPLGDDFTVYSGHGPKTNIGYERQNNPFLD